MHSARLGFHVAIVLSLTALLQGCSGARGGAISAASAATSPKTARAKPNSVPGTIVWRTGTDDLGPFDLPNADDGQCSWDKSVPGYVRPVIAGHNVSFTVRRNTLGTYHYPDENTPPFRGSSTCYRNQINPKDPHTGTNFMLNLGSHYTFTFQTVVRFNGNTLNEGLGPGKGIAFDIPAIVWQTHSNGEGPKNGSGPCDMLLIGNTQADAWTGLYGNVTNGGKATWGFKTCSDPDRPAGNRYFSRDTLHDGEVDNWRIDITAQLVGQSGGSVVVQRNGRVVYNTSGGVCDARALHGCWWNFGPYMFVWPNSNEPPGWNEAGVTVQFNDMTLYKQ